MDDRSATFVIDVLTVVARFQAFDAVSWEVTDGTVRFYVDCSGLFTLGEDDRVELTPANLGLLGWAYQQVAKTTDGDDSFAPWLFCATVRQQRPAEAAYPPDQRLWALFDAVTPDPATPSLAVTSAVEAVAP